MDRAAGLHYRAGRIEPALSLLEQWRQAAPHDPTPIVRQAIMLHQQQRDSGSFEKIQQAMSLTTGRRRANIAFLGARMALQSYVSGTALLSRPDGSGEPSHDPMSQALTSARDFLNDCLHDEPRHAQALWCLAAVRWLQGDAAALVKQAPQMDDAEAADPRYHYLAGLCHLLAGQHDAVLKACERIAARANGNGRVGRSDLAAEAGYLAAIAHIALGQPGPAIDALKHLTANRNSPTLNLAHGLLDRKS